MQSTVKGRKCVCGNNIWLKVGFPKVLEGQRVRCTDCGNDSYPHKARDTVGDVFGLIILIVTAIFMVMFSWLAIFIHEGDKK